MALVASHALQSGKRIASEATHTEGQVSQQMRKPPRWQFWQTCTREQRESNMRGAQVQEGRGSAQSHRCTGIIIIFFFFGRRDFALFSRSLNGSQGATASGQGSKHEASGNRKGASNPRAHLVVHLVVIVFGGKEASRQRKLASCRHPTHRRREPLLLLLLLPYKTCSAAGKSIRPQQRTQRNRRHDRE